ncbi:MAG TPA: response regulator [Gemmatimonadales bacterium]|jgi:CheY-like chemotaxis protein
MRVLIVEDDNAVRQAFSKILEQAGFVVVQAPDADHAFSEIKKSSKFDAVVCDVALPGLEGTAFFEHLSQHNPELADRLVFVTGYSRDDNTKKLLEHTGRPFLTKPVDVKDFLAAVVRTAQHPGAK